MSQDIENILRKAIAESGLSHYRLAKETGLDAHTIARFMAETQTIRLDIAGRIAARLGLDNPQSEKQTAAALKTGTDNLPVSAVAAPADTTHKPMETNPSNLAFYLAPSDGKPRTLANAGGLKAAQRDIEQTRVDSGESRNNQGNLPMRWAGVEPTTFGFGGRRLKSQSPHKSTDSAPHPKPLGVSVFSETRNIDPRLIELADQWADLPEALRAGIMAMARAAK